ncbi:MAG: lipoyl(octanoyl) transferase LipB [Burkholderiaceae bacterium]
MGIDTHFLGRVEYLPTYAAMQAHTERRASEKTNINVDMSLSHGHNQLWICEHFPVFTQGLAGKNDHVLSPGDIPVVQTNRGGQVTYHGPGQVVAYPLIDLQAAGYYVKEYVFKIEEAVIQTLAAFNVTGHRVRGAPGIYVRTDDPHAHAALNLTEADLRGGALDSSNGDKLDLTPIKNIGKIAALGIKVSRHCTYHGVALNVAMDLEPFSRINPCGYAGLRTVDLASLGVAASWDAVAQVLAQKLCSYLAP